MLKLDTEKVIFAFTKDNEPAVKCDLPQTLVLQTKDCFSGDIKSETDTMASLDYDTLNPSTGPVYFNDVVPGDVLEIKIKRISCQSPGFTMCVPEEGLLGDQVKKSLTKFYPFDNQFVYITDKIKIEYKPMIGVIGLAPADGAISTVNPGDHGGNMDTTMIHEGATLFLPVKVAGGLLAVGDLHAAMGDGESFFTGLEVSGEVELDVKVRKDLKMEIPFVLADENFASIATEKEVHGALNKAMKHLVKFIVDNGELDFYDAGFLAGLSANLQISQVVDPLKTARMSIPLNILQQTGIDLS